MNRLRKKGTRASTARALKMECLERREVFAVGGLDLTFNGSGKVSTDFGGTYDGSSDSAIQSDGKIVLVGTTTAGGSGFNFALTRYNSNGSLDETFGGAGGIGAGQVATDFEGAQDTADQVLIQPDGKILVIGTSTVLEEYSGTDNTRFAVARYLADGSPDNTFGELGKVIFDVDADNVFSVAGAFLTGDQLLLVSGGVSQFLTRIQLTDGSLDTNFGTNGILSFESPLAVVDVAFHDNCLVEVGMTDDYKLAFARFSLNGELDASFGNNGLANIAPSYSNAILRAVAVQADGSIVGAGNATVGGAPRLVVARVLPNGQADASFSVDGVVEFTGMQSGTLKDIAFGNNGNIIAVGDVSTWADGQGSMAIVRIQSDGAVDQNFGDDGIVALDFGQYDSATSVLAYANGKILVTGYSGNDFAGARINGAGRLSDFARKVRPDQLLGATHDETARRNSTTRLKTVPSAPEPAVGLGIMYKSQGAKSGVRPVSAGPTLRAAGTNSSLDPSVLDDLLAQWDEEARIHGGSNANIQNFPHQLSLRVSGSH